MKNLLFFLFLLISTQAYTQKQTSSSVKQAQKSYNLANQYISYKLYDKAIAELNQAVAQDQNFTAAYQQLGDIYRKTGNFAQAVKSYQKVLEIDPKFHSLSYYGLAESELNTGDYSNSLIHFKEYLSFEGISQSGKNRVNKYINDCLFSLEALKSPVSFKPVNMGSGINSSENEYLPVITADEAMIIFTRQTNRNEDFYTSIKQNGVWSKAEYLSKEINTYNYNEGAQCISPDGNYLFFTGCNRPDGAGRCDIYISRREGNGWSKPFNIGPPVNTSGWESQPSISADGKTLYFVSTRQGGYGGYDIWKTELTSNGTWTIPQNLGPEINTEYDEQSPFIHPDDESLYFSSNGWPGFGNKDLFVSRKIFIDGKHKSWKKPENLGYPINTFREESGLSISSNGRLGFFASNQKEGFGGLDIYSFELPEKVRPVSVTYIKGIVYDRDSKEFLNAKIQIINLKTGEQIFDDVADPETGQFLATMMSEKSFGLNVSMDGYLFFSQNFNTMETQEGKPFLLEIPLQKIEIGRNVVLSNIFFESNQFELLPESKSELMLLVKFLNENPQIKIEIGGHTDNIGDEGSNQKLSESRAMSVYNFLISRNIPADKLSFKGYGESQPVHDNLTEEGRKNNRRTEFKILSN